MKTTFASVDHDTPLLMPPDLRDWVPEGGQVHFIMDAVGLLDVGLARVNERGADSTPLEDGLSFPEEIARRQNRLDQGRAERAE
jgi:hypothetical protein